MDARESLERLLESDEFAPNIVVNRLLPAQEGIFAPFPEGLDARIVASLKKRGIERLYIHQVEVWKAVKTGKNVVVVTPTASGKTICYNLPCVFTRF